MWNGRVWDGSDCFKKEVEMRIAGRSVVKIKINWSMRREGWRWLKWGKDGLGAGTI